MSDAQDGKNAKRARALAQSYTADESTGLWDPTQLQFMVDQGLSVPTGARFRAPTSATELASWGFAGGGAGPDPMIGLQEWLTKNNMGLQDFQSQTGGLPLVFNADGTATYDPSAQKQSFSYLNPDDGAFHKVAPLLFAAIATGGFGLAGAGGTVAPATTGGFSSSFAPTLSEMAGGALTGGSVAPMAGMDALIANAATGGLGTTGILSASELAALGSTAAGAGAGLGAGALDTFLNTTPMDFGTTSGSFSSSIDLPSVTNQLQIPTQGGPIDPSFTELPSGPVNPVNTNLVPGGMNTIEEIISQITSGGAATLGTVGAGGAIGAALGSAPTEGVGSLLERILGNGGSTAASAVSNLVKQLTGKDVSSGMLSMLGQGLGAGIGLLGSNQQTNALKDLYSQTNAQRAPFLNKATGYLNNPDSFYTSPEATGAANAVLRQLSAGHGNPAGSPTAQSLATGALYDRYLNSVNTLGSLGLGGQGIQANLGQQIAQSSGQPYAIAGNTVAGMTSDNSMNDMLQRMFRQQFSLA